VRGFNVEKLVKKLYGVIACLYKAGMPACKDLFLAMKQVVRARTRMFDDKIGGKAEVGSTN
jgi:hypothetical protein